MEQRYAHHPWKRTVVVVTGSLLLIAGTIMLVTPGPGLVTIVGGLALLARVYRWPRRILAAVRAKLRRGNPRRSRRGRTA
jgi:uncharacterized protein (TIGR02611 family)